MLQAKKYLHVHDSSKNSKRRNGVGTVCSVRILYLHPENIVAEVYDKRDKRYVI